MYVRTYLSLILAKFEPDNFLESALVVADQRKVEGGKILNERRIKLIVVDWSQDMVKLLRMRATTWVSYTKWFKVSITKRIDNNDDTKVKSYFIILERLLYDPQGRVKFHKNL